MITKIEITDELFSPSLCEANPNKLYVFGDNMVRKGKGGQAIIRDCDNSFGIPTKVKPDRTEDAYFSDTSHRHYTSITKSISNLVLTQKYGKFDAIVFSSNGYGTGLAELDTRAPFLFNLLEASLHNFFYQYVD